MRAPLFSAIFYAMNKHSVCKTLKIFIAILCAAGVGFFALWRFPNRDLTVTLVDNVGTVLEETFFNSESIASGKGNALSLPLEKVGKKNDDGMYVAAVSSIRIYGFFKSLPAKELDFNSFSRMIQGSEGGEWKWTPKSVEVSGKGACTLLFSDDFANILKRVSKSLLQERLIAAGWFACFMAVLFIIVNVFEEKLSDTAKSNHSFILEMKKFFGHLARYKSYMIYSARADLNAEVANSYLNRLWWLLEPFFNMLVYVIIFGKFMGSSVKNYSTFVFSALLMWNYFSKTINYSVKLVRNSRDIVTKVYVPKFVLLLSNMFLNFFKLIFSMSVLVFMMVFFKVQIGVNIFFVIPAYVLMIMISFGIGMVLLHFGVFIDDLAYAVNILLNLLMFLSGVFYNVMTGLPEPLNVLMMTVNPVALFVDVMRNALLLNRAADLPLLGLWLFVSLLLCYAGVHIVYKNENSYVKII